MHGWEFKAGIYATPAGATIIACINDILLIGSAEDVQSMRSPIRRHFTIKDLGNVKFFLHMSGELDQGWCIVYLSQRVYLN